ncbi:SusD/RagB family nutrient-binding outer membrane lipoprotein [Formosa sp. 3Alg 14/1]|uniref:SusD/RagB family nutrient-binding outer membrane lipoprotein n=1 Tax=Formosa sp. 3Alg 14/1 TaxID=3382190 RepID=UPI0039BEC2EA
MKLNKKIYTAFILASTLFACTDDYVEMNTDPNSLTNVPYSTLITNSEISILNSYNSILDFQVSWSRYNVRTVYVHNERYALAGDGTNFNVYSGHLKNLQVAIAKAEEAGDDNTVAVGNILKAYAFQNMTDWYGDIPYFEALSADDPESPTIYPKYDSQQSIYMDLIEQLKTANAMIDPTANIGTSDVIFDGDMMQWKRFCNSLLLRIYMRMSLVDAATAKSGVEMIASDPSTYPVINSNENAAFKYWLANDAIYRSPYYIQPSNIDRQQNATSEFMINFLKDRSDGRLPVYAEPVGTTGEYVGLPLGAEGNAQELSVMGLSEFRSADSPTRILRYSEVLFIYAEAALNGWSVGYTAEEAYNAAITASFNEYGLDAGDYLSDPLVDFNGGKDQRELIGDQKWCAIYPDGNQGWAEVRRTGFPKYVAETEPVESLYSGKGTIVRRPYPYSEGVSNPIGFDAALEAQPGIIDEKFGAGVWWDIN